MKIRLVIWVTSDCNLACKWCSQNYTMIKNKGYHMSLQEVKKIVNSLKRRNIHINIIEITGGEASLWKNIKKGVALFKEVADTVTLVTNGNNAELVMSLNLDSWIISASQATKEHISQYDSVRNKIMFNSHSHKKMPEEPIENSVPAECVIRQTPTLEPQNNIMYLKGKVYYCCNTYALSKQVRITKDVVCDFEDDFITKYSNKKYDKAMCAYCLCNSIVWNKI